MQLKHHLASRPAAALSFLIGAAFAGNYFHLHLFIGAGFLFGSIATLLVLRLFGAGWGAVAGIASAAFALFETSNYAAAAALLVLEPILVGLALRYGKCRNIALVDGAYWLLVGMPLMWGIELWPQHGDLSSASYFAMILGFNGIFNALAAGLLLDYLPLRRWAGVAEEVQRVALQHLTFNLLAAFLAFSAFSVIVLNGKDELTRMESSIQGQLDRDALEIQSHLKSWSDQRQQLVQKLGARFGNAGAIQAEQLQQSAGMIRLVASDFEAIHSGTGAGSTIASAYYNDGAFNGKHLDLSNWSWFHEMKRTLRPVVSDVYIDSVSHAPTLVFGVPLTVTSAGTRVLASFVAVQMRLSEVKKLLEMHVREKALKVTLLDRQQRVIASTRSDLKEMVQFPSPGKSSAPVWDASGGMVTSGLSLQQIYEARYVREARVGPGNDWMLYLEIPAWPYLLTLQQRLVNNLALMWAGIIIAFLVASVVSRRLVEPLQRLVDATTHIKARLQGDEDIRLDHSPVQEIEALVENFTEMTLELNRSYTDLARSNENLEKTVATRTEELTHANRQLKQHLAEREQFEIALARHSQQLEQTAAELVNQKFALDQHSIVGIADPRGKITYVNDKFCEISQYSREELIWQDHRILNSGHHDPAFFREMWATITAGKVWRAEVCNRKKAGGLYWVDTTIVPFMDESGRPYQYVSIRTDITQRKQAEVELIRARDMAETANQAKSEFLSRMSHELRTPLNAILGFGQLLESDGDDPLSLSQQENVEHITKAGWHLLELVNEVLDLARIESGKMQFNFADVLLSEMAEECLDLIFPLAAAREITVDDQIAQCRSHFVRTDRTRLKQVLLNFLSNAVKYNRHGGNIVLACEYLSGQRLRVSVSDTGPGIPAVELEQLFVAFNRLGADRTEVQGAGIGLAVSKHLVELMGGEVGVSSVVGEGSKFWMDLPESISFSPDTPEDIIGPATELVSSAGAVKLSSSNKRRVLYVEDNPANRALVSGILRQRRPDLELICECSAEAGLQTALSQPPDLILTDLNLPGITGLDLLELLAGFDDLRDIPVIALSADAMPVQVEKCLQAGFLAYLSKPINVEQFLAALDHALDLVETRMELI